MLTANIYGTRRHPKRWAPHLTHLILFNPHNNPGMQFLSLLHFTGGEQTPCRGQHWNGDPLGYCRACGDNCYSVTYRKSMFCILLANPTVYPVPHPTPFPYCQPQGLPHLPVLGVSTCPTCTCSPCKVPSTFQGLQLEV